MNLTGKRVLLFGDSQIQGLGRHLPALLLAQGAAAVDVSAHPGMSLKTAYETQGRAAAGYDVVILSFGGNNPPPSKTMARTFMDRLLAQIGPNREVAWITVLPAADQALQVGRGRMETWQKEYLPTKGVSVLDGRALASGIRRADGLHLTAGGYRIFAQKVARAIAALSAGVPWWPVGLGLILGIGAAIGSAAVARNHSGR